MVLLVLALSLMVPAALYLVCNPGPVADRLARMRDRILWRRGDAESTQRPIEEVAAEIRRLGRRYHSPQVSHVKADSLRQAYDEALVAGCRALGIDHLMSVLAPGPDLDHERARVEDLLHKWGIDLSGLGDLGDVA